MGATGVEKTSTNEREEPMTEEEAPKACSILDPDCEACQ
jgi:ribonucleoside-diphosphate reductase alpha chain